MQIISLTPSTGGILQPNQVIGRDLDIVELTDKLYRQSINLSALRRSGKSSLLALLDAHLRQLDEFVSVYLEVEGIGNCDSFIEKLYLKFKEQGLIKEKAIQKIDKAFDQLLGRFSKIALPGGFSAELNKRRQVWEKQLDELLKEVIAANPNKIIVISLDEFSIMLDKIEDEREASELIGILRAVMHNTPYKEVIRFIYCGSIGIDLVLDKLKSAGNNIGQPLNHMYDYELEPLVQDQAIYLAECFKRGCQLHLSDAAMEYICKLAENIPYYIDYMFSLLRYRPQPISIETIERAYLDMLSDPHDRAEFKHFYERIILHYPQQQLSLSILNILSKQTQAQSERTILQELSADRIIGREELLMELDRLRNDDYLIRQIVAGERVYQFKYEILRRWWQINKAY